MDKPTKITFAELRELGVRGVLIYCADYRCSHSIAISGDAWPDDVRLSDIEDRFVCQACGKRGAHVRPDFNWGKQVSVMGIADVGRLAARNGRSTNTKGGRSICRPSLPTCGSAHFRLVIAVRSAESLATPTALHQLEPKPPGLIAVMLAGLKLVVL